MRKKRTTVSFSNNEKKKTRYFDEGIFYTLF